MKKVFLGIGHGGSDPGAVGLNGFKEKDLNLAIGLACRDELERHGVQVKMSRTKDENDTLTEEIKECNAYDPDVAVDIHNNAGGGDGAEAFYQIANGQSRNLANDILGEIKVIGQNLRVPALKTKLISTGANKGKDWFGFLRQCSTTAVLVECAFVDSADIYVLDTAAEQKVMGIAIAKGILKHLGLAYKDEAVKPSKPKGFFPAHGYFKRGDVHENVGKIATFMRRVFPAYTSDQALGDYYGPFLISAITEFQRRTGLEPDGCTGPLTLAMLERYGFKR